MVNRRVILLMVVLPLGGCGQNVGWMLKPVPIEERLVESVVSRDPGLFVSDKIVVVDVDGLLLNQRRAGMLGEKDNPVSLFIEKLDKARRDPNVKGVILRINSPGGTVTASDIMHRRTLRFRSNKKVPVVAMLEDVGTSGAYYLSCATDAILAHPTTVTGSIGVMVQTVSFAGTMEKLGIDARAVTSGPRKDLASPLKPLDEKDLAILQGLVDTYYQRFLDVVAEGRSELNPKDVKELADGRVFTGEHAKANGLVDALGYMDDAVVLVKRAGGLKRVKVVIYHRPFGYRANVYSAAPNLPPQVNLLNISIPNLLSLPHPQFLYLWTGGSSAN